MNLARFGKSGSSRSLMSNSNPTNMLSSSANRKRKDKPRRTSAGSTDTETTHGLSSSFTDDKSRKSAAGSARPGLNRRQGSNRSLMGNSSVGSHQSQVIASLWDSHSSLPLSKQQNGSQRGSRRSNFRKRLSQKQLVAAAALKDDSASTNNSLNASHNGMSAQSAPALLSASRRRERYEREYDKVYLPNNTSRETARSGSRRGGRAGRRSSMPSNGGGDMTSSSVVSLPVDQQDGLAGRVRHIESNQEIRMKRQGSSKFLDQPDGMYLRVEEDGLPVGPVTEAEGREDGSFQDFVIEVPCGDGDEQEGPFVEHEEQQESPLMLDMIIEIPEQAQERPESSSPKPRQQLQQQQHHHRRKPKVVIEMPSHVEQALKAREEYLLAQRQEEAPPKKVQEVPPLHPLDVVIEEEESQQTPNLSTYHKMREQALQLTSTLTTGAKDAPSVEASEDSIPNLATYHEMREKAMMLSRAHGVVVSDDEDEDESTILGSFQEIKNHAMKLVKEQEEISARKDKKPNEDEKEEEDVLAVVDDTDLGANNAQQCIMELADEVRARKEESARRHRRRARSSTHQHDENVREEKASRLTRDQQQKQQQPPPQVVVQVSKTKKKEMDHHHDMKKLVGNLAEHKENMGRVDGAYTREELRRLKLDSERVAQAQLDAADEVRRLKAVKLAKKSKKKKATTTTSSSSSSSSAHQNVRDLANKLQLAKVRRETVC